MSQAGKQKVHAELLQCTLGCSWEMAHFWLQRLTQPRRYRLYRYMHMTHETATGIWTQVCHVTVIAVHSGGKKREINSRMSKTVLFNQLRSQLLWWDSRKSTHNHVCTTTRKPNKTREVGSSSKCPFKPSVIRKSLRLLQIGKLSQIVTENSEAPTK